MLSLLAFSVYFFVSFITLTEGNPVPVGELGNLSQMSSKPKFGTLKLCPPGGRSFFEAFQLACPMRRKRSVFDRLRRNEDTFGDGEYRPATVNEIMKICCIRGCEVSDLFSLCAPFSVWD
ncbi:hypothetical protein AB6A40_002263 [Gnathostoma spinigerum]|uniref:Insulin-like domain-containing protein n=1 Tax=Gnathostoma spinigerum TaxID=75299 RepID=A0ABD6E654_9BILA